MSNRFDWLQLFNVSLYIVDISHVYRNYAAIDIINEGYRSYSSHTAAQTESDLEVKLNRCRDENLPTDNDEYRLYKLLPQVCVTASTSLVERNTYFDVFA